MPVGVPSRLRLVGGDSACFGGTVIPFEASIKYLGVRIDQTLSMRDQISSTCRACFLELRRIASIRSCLSGSACAKVVAALIISRLDYCNSSLIGLSDEDLYRLQRVQNCAARLISGKHKRDHISPVLRELHWLPVKHRCQYKMAVLSYRHFDGSLPVYLSQSLTTYSPSRTLRSSAEKLLKLPKFNLKSVGERSFSFQAPRVWNSLPSSLRNSPTLPEFKRELKTFLFRKAFQ